MLNEGVGVGGIVARVYVCWVLFEFPYEVVGGFRDDFGVAVRLICADDLIGFED